MKTGLLILVAVVAVHMSAQDIKGSKDHPIVQRYEGSAIIDYAPSNYDALLIPTGRVTPVGNQYGFPKSAKVEGQITRIRYKAPVGRTSLEVFRNYESALKEAGFEILFTCVRSECGDADTFAQTLFGTVSPPLTLNQKTQAFLSAHLKRPTGDVYVRVFTVENRSWYSEAKTEEGQVIAQLDVIETKSMQSGMVTVDASAMLKALKETGRVALYGIYFDTGKSDLKPESKPALDEIAKLLSSESAIRLLVVGHTDTAGSMESNLELSERRAVAVVDELTSAYGIGAGRLTPVGVAFAAPVATNRTADGKAKNRRVELVEY